MLNHIHLIIQSPDVSGFIRNFKEFTAKEFIRNIAATEPRVLQLLTGKEGYEFWEKTNMPKIVESEDYFLQKVNYIHENPVRKGYVREPENWVYSSANPEALFRIEEISNEEDPEKS